MERAIKRSNAPREAFIVFSVCHPAHASQNEPVKRSGRSKKTCLRCQINRKKVGENLIDAMSYHTYSGIVLWSNSLRNMRQGLAIHRLWPKLGMETLHQF